ncbi:MAG: choice-of-anchor B family protein [Saprospiraceae bacterium]
MKRKLPLYFALLIFSAKIYSQAFNTTLLGNWHDPSLPIKSNLKYNDCWGFEKNGREYAVMGSLTKVHFFEVTNPASLYQVQNFTNGANSLWRDFKYYKGYIYAVADEGSEGLVVFNVNNINASTNRITQVFSSNTFFLRCHNVWVDTLAGRLYCAGTNTKSDGIKVYDIKTNPAIPVLCANISLRTGSASSTGYVHDVHVYANRMYCSHIYVGRMDIYDVTSINNWNPGNAVITSYTRLGYALIPGSGYNHSSYLTEDKSKLIMAEETHGRPLTIVDITDPSNITISGTMYSCSQCATGSTTLADGIGPLVHNPFVKGDLAFLAYYHEGLVVYNISNPALPVKVAQYDTDFPNANTYSGYLGAWGTYPYLPSQNIIVSDILYGLSVVQLAPSVQPVQLKAKVFLNNVNPATGLMDNYITTLFNFPNTDPYANPTNFNGQFTHVNNSVATVSTQALALSGANAIVDWVFLELRQGSSGSTSVVSTQAGLLQRDGDIVGMDGVSPLKFPVIKGTYFVAVRHRNHLGFRTVQKIALSDTPTILDFTNGSIAVYGQAGLSNPAPMTYSMLSGDATSDGSIDALDYIRFTIETGLFDDYMSNSDFNLDGSSDSIDSINWEINNGKFEDLN